MSMRWAERYPWRLQLEMKLLSTAGNGRFVRVSGALAYDEEVVAQGTRFGLRLIYPDNFPFEPPRAHLLYPSLPITAQVHRFIDGGLCLHGAAEWHPTQTGLWLRNRAIAWVAALLQYSRTGVWPESPTP